MPPKSKSTSNPAATLMGPAPPATSAPQSVATTLLQSAAAKPPPPEETETALGLISADFKAELLAALREEMVGIFRTELETAMTNNLTQIKSELQSVKTELNDSMAAIKSEMEVLRVTVNDMEGSLLTCTDDVVSLKSKVDKLSAQLVTLDSKCEDLEARSHRNNIKIIGLPEGHGPVDAATVSTLLKDAFCLEKELVVDHAHRSLQPKPKLGKRPRPIIARLHYYADCVNILRRARTQQRIKLMDSTISIFPDLTARMAKARATFNDVRHQLRDIPGVRTLTGTKISVIPVGLCEDLKSLRNLDLSYNGIKELPVFQGCFKLEEISLQHNHIREVQGDTFQGLASLRILDLSRNEIASIHKDAFISLTALTNLDLSMNSLSTMPTTGLSALSQLKLFGNMQMKGDLAAKNLPKLRSISVPYAYQCCAFVGCDSIGSSSEEYDRRRGVSIQATAVVAVGEADERVHPDVHCSPSPGAFKPCEHLLGSWMIRLTVWFICLVALVFNALVLAATFLRGRVMSSAKLLVGLLAASNLLMGVYVGLLSALDGVTWGAFGEFGVRWETGLGCQAAGFLAVFSSELSILFLTLAAMERSLMVRKLLRKSEQEQQGQRGRYGVAAMLLVILAGATACLPLFHVGEFSSSPLCLPFSTGESTSALGYTVALVLLNSLSYLLMVVVYTHLYCSLGKADLTEPLQASMIRHVAWLIFTNCIFFCPMAAFSFAPLFTGVANSPEIMKTVTLIFFPLPACFNPVLYVFFNQHFREDWRGLKRLGCMRRRAEAGPERRPGGGIAQDSSALDEQALKFGTHTQLQGDLTLCSCCESVLLAKPLVCRHFKWHSCPALQVEGYWSECTTPSAQSEYADEEDSFISDCSDQVQACGRACFYQSRGFPLVHYSCNISRIRD
ncbi:hypothetical protein GJAV_G00062190 [Gymnothorax javanicus]|nr:hypothetical protein GJAV_G00062190 [Gymnothorax javanicus]